MGLGRQLSLLLPFLDPAGVVRTPLSPPKRIEVKNPPVEDRLLSTLWFRLRWAYFPDRSDLDDYTLEWSTRRQKRVLASCNIRKRCIRVARELLEPSAIRWLEVVLYHELCHAVIGENVDHAHGKRQWHGRTFRELERLHPDIPALDTWIRSGGWLQAVRSNRARAAWRARRGVLP
jgi:hypothetical protein